MTTITSFTGQFVHIVGEEVIIVILSEYIKIWCNIQVKIYQLLHNVTVHKLQAKYFVVLFSIKWFNPII